MFMSSPTTPSLDFDKADFGTPAAGITCASCSKELRLTYFEVNGMVACPECRALIAAADRPEGGFRRFVLAAIFGVLGGAAGAAVWYAVATLFNLEIGLIAILVGWLVGTGVHKGSEGRGGLRYQLLAAFVTYASIISTYIPPIIEAARNQSQNASASAAPQQNGPPADVEVVATPFPLDRPSPRAASSAEAKEELGLGGFLVAVASLVGILFAAPFLAGFSNIIGILIIFFALQQAWSMNRRRVTEVKGPFRVAAAPVVAALPAHAAAAAEVPPVS